MGRYSHLHPEGIWHFEKSAVVSAVAEIIACVLTFTLRGSNLNKPLSIYSRRYIIVSVKVMQTFACLYSRKRNRLSKEI